MMSIDTTYEKMYAPLRVIGLDEVGYGAWAGPVVVAGVCCIPDKMPPALVAEIRDSKLLSRRKREEISGALKSLPDSIFMWETASSPVEEIDAVNVLHATHKAMIRAIFQLRARMTQSPGGVFVDGVRTFPLDIPVHAVRGGDQTCLSIAAASVLAKVTRDALMQNLHDQHPMYGWNRNVGYGTLLHRESLAQYGVTLHHRRSYKPIQAMLGLCSDSCRRKEMREGKKRIKKGMRPERSVI